MSNLTWQAWALLSALFAALTAIFAKIGVENIGADQATFIRTVVVVILLGILLIVTGQWTTSVSPKAGLFLVLSGLATGTSWLCYFRALKMGDVAKVGPIDKLSVVLVAFFAMFFLGERLLAKDWLGIAMMVGGAILLASR
jgi:transporter family protein